MKKWMLIIPVAGIIGLVVYFLIPPSLPNNFGKVDARLFGVEGERQPLLVAFGGSEGGNVYSSDALADFRQVFIDSGFAFLAVGYFGLDGLPEALDRISLNAIHDTVMAVARRNPSINVDRIILLGGSRGGELVLNLASYFNEYAGVVSLVPGSVNLPAMEGGKETSSWVLDGEQVPYLSMWGSVSVLITSGGFYSWLEEMVRDPEIVAESIPVENMGCPVLFVSAVDDKVWPSELMASVMMDRLKKSGYGFHTEHVALAGGHRAPGKYSQEILQWLLRYVK